MVLILLATVLILAIAFFQVVQGLFSALIMTVLTILCTAAAFTFYEPLAELLYTRQAAYADAGALIALLVIPLLVVRILFDKLIGSNVVIGVWADRVGGGILGLITGMMLVGTLTTALQMLPFGESVFTFEPFDGALQRKQNLAPFYPDRFTVGFMNVLSGGSLSGNRDLTKTHEDLLLEAHCARNTAGKSGRVDALPDAMKSVRVFQAPKQRWGEEIPDNPLLPSSVRTRDVIVRVEIDKSARDEADGNDSIPQWRLPATHFRMVSVSGRNYYPVGYLTYGEDGGWKAHGAPEKNGKALVGEIILARPVEGDKLTVDWVYRIPKVEEEDPYYIVFRRVSKSNLITKIEDNKMPPSKNALDRKGWGSRRRRSRRRR